jgi:hypothetical protein
MRTVRSRLLPFVAVLTGLAAPTAVRADDSWTCFPGLGAPVRLRNGDVECAAKDGNNCLWGECPEKGTSIMTWRPGFRIDPLTCGPEHLRKSGSTDGYSYPGHWCVKGCVALGCDRLERRRPPPPPPPPPDDRGSVFGDDSDRDRDRNRDRDRDRDRERDGDRGRGRAATTDREIDGILSVVRGQPPRNKEKVFGDQVGARWINVSQAMRLLEALGGDLGRLTVLELVAPRLVDRQNSRLLLQAFPDEGERRRARELLER